MCESETWWLYISLYSPSKHLLSCFHPIPVLNARDDLGAIKIYFHLYSELMENKRITGVPLLSTCHLHHHFSVFSTFAGLYISGFGASH